MGRRVGAWILDGIFSGFLVLIPLVLVLAWHGVAFNRAALDQLSYYPYYTLTEPLLVVNLTSVMVAAGLYVLLLAVYYAGCWAAFRGTPGQRLLSLQVVDVSTSGNLSPWQAIVRWLIVAGLAEMASAVVFVVFINLLATVPLDFQSTGGMYATSAWNLDPQVRSANTLSTIVSGCSSLWSIALLIMAAKHPLKRGLHDRLAGSIVLGKAPVTAPGWPGYPGWGYPGGGPAPTGYPGWGHQPGGYPGGAYQPGGYPPTAPGWGYPQGGYPQTPPAPGGWSPTPPANPGSGGAEPDPQAPPQERPSA
jgi:hypothetical protein